MAEFKNLITLTQVFDGAPGEPGAPGKDGQKYYIETNQEEILKFKDREGWIFSPYDLNFSIYEISKVKYIITSDTILKEDKNYYELVDNKFILTSDEEYNSEKEYYELNSILPTSKNFNFGYIYNNNYFSLYSSSDIILPSYLSILKNNKVVSFSVDSFFELEEYSNLLESTSFYFKFDWLEEGMEVAIKPIACRNGVSSDMATFNLHAYGFNAAIQKTKLDFSEEGLKIYNGGIKIFNNNGKKVFWADEDGNLSLEGTIYATNGEFTGKVIANSGEIGDFEIREGILYSTESRNPEAKPSIILNGKEGTIEANNIVLGEGATIDNLINLGSAILYNPSKNEGKVLQSGEILLNQDGTMNLGEILIGKDKQGEQEIYYIKSKNEQWKISATGTAKFNDIYANNVHLQNSILEIGSIQSLGSLMLVKDAWEIIEANENNTILTIKLPTRAINLRVGDYVYDGITTYKVVDIKLINADDKGQADTAFITLNNSFTGLQNTITKFGTPTTENASGDCILSFLGESENNLQGFASGNSITLSTFEENGNSLSYKKTLVLGDLTGITSNGGTGLYAENVHLYGSLTTQGINDNDQVIFAGINTQSMQNSSKFTNEKVILFAGAKSETSIGDSYFHVTDQGSLYASKGIFEGAIITKSKIEGSEIHTAKIYGTGGDSENTEDTTPALSIYDTSKNGGIVFKEIIENENAENTEKISLKITNDLFSRENIGFIEFDSENKATFSGAFTTTSLTIEGESINSDSGLVKINNSLEIFDESVISTKATYLQGEVYFGIGDKHHYTQVKDGENLKGYDLYIN